MKIEFRKNYYNGKISPFANISKAFEFDCTDEEIYLTVTREHFLEEDSNKTSKLVAKTKLSELFYDVDETFFKETLFQIKSFYLGLYTHLVQAIPLIFLKIMACL